MSWRKIALIPGPIRSVPAACSRAYIFGRAFSRLTCATRIGMSGVRLADRDGSGISAQGMVGDVAPPECHWLRRVGYCLTRAIYQVLFCIRTAGEVATKCLLSCVCGMKLVGASARANRA